MKEVTGGKGPEEGPLPVECGGSLWYLWLGYHFYMGMSNNC